MKKIFAFFIAFYLSPTFAIYAQPDAMIDIETVNYRLPNTSIPLHYFLRIETDIHNGDDKYLGFEKIRVRITDTTDVLTMHCNSETVKIKSVDLFDNQEILIKSTLQFTFTPDLDFFHINLPSQSIKNTELILAIAFQGELSDLRAIGFFKTYTFDESNNREFLISTYLQPTYARMAFPCYDEPQIRATIQLEIKHDKSYKAISNMPGNITADQGNNYVITSFETTPLIQCYLLAFVVSKFDSIENVGGKLKQRIFGDSQKIHDGFGNFSLKVADEVYEKMSENFKFQTSLKKLDHVGVPGMTYAIENFGMVTYDENILLINPTYDEVVLESMHKGLIGVIAHELMHQLMGSTTILWWQYLWLNEGLAVFYQHYIPHLLYSNYNYMEDFRNQVLDKCFYSNDNNETMNEYVEMPEEIFMKFNWISFDKAAVVIRMFHEALTPATFTKGLSYYLERTKFQPATPDDLHRALQKAYDEDNENNEWERKLEIGKMMESWENQPGYPILSVRRDGRDIIITQSRYQLKEGFIDYPKIYNEPLPIYSIPLTYATSSNPNFNLTKAHLWMTTASTVIPNIINEANDWIIFNIQQVGFYKVDYSRDLWTTIINGYKTNPESIHRINREVLHEEMFDGWINLGTQSISNCLELLGVLGGEREGVVWEKAGYYIEKLNEFFLFSEFYENFIDFLHNQLTPHLDILRVPSSSSGMVENLKLKGEIERWCMESHHESFLNLQLNQLLRYMETDDYNDSPEFCSAFRIANSTIYQYFFNKVFNEKFEFNTQLISGLACTKDGEKLKEYLENLLSPSTQINDFVISQSINKAMTSSEIGLGSVMDISYNRINDISRITKFPPHNLIFQLSNLINSRQHLERFKTLTNKLVYDGLMTRDETMPLVTAIEQKLQSPQWSEIRDWFEAREETTTTSSSSSTLFLRQMETTTLGTTSALSTSIRIIAICMVIKSVLL